jgi:hypothetical protein
MSSVIFHTGEQLRQHHRRIGCPVAVVAAVQLAVRPVERDGEMRHATRAEDHTLASALVNRAIADEPDVSAELLPYPAEVEQAFPGCFLCVPERAAAVAGVEGPYSWT